MSCGMTLRHQSVSKIRKKKSTACRKKNSAKKYPLKHTARDTSRAYGFARRYEYYRPSTLYVKCIGLSPLQKNIDKEFIKDNDLGLTLQTFLPAFINE
jgi:hypothetical protein